MKVKRSQVVRLVFTLALATAFTAGCSRDRITTAPDGTRTIVKADGTQVVSHPDGSQTITKPDGSQTAVAATGAVSSQSANGAQTSVNPNGTAPAPAPAVAQTGPPAGDGGARALPPNPQPATSNPYLTQAPQSANASNAAVLAPLMVPAGTPLSIRINQRISVKHSRAGDPFSGTVVHGVDVNGNVAIPEGSRVNGVVSRAHRRGHFKGSSILQLRLTSLDLRNGGHYELDSQHVTRTKKGKGKRSLGIIGGGTGLGMLVGGLATGGVGLVVGGLAGAGGGTAVAGLTGNRDIDYPAESVITFRLADAIDIR